MYLKVNPEVQKALENNQPVVAINDHFSWNALSTECGNSFEC